MDAITEQRATIIRQLTELHGAISVHVGSEEGGPIGRVLEHAGSILASCLIDFASDNVAEDRGHADAVEAESFIMAAAALADEEKRARQRDAGSAAAMRKMAREADALCNALDHFNMEHGRAEAPSPAPATQQSTEASEFVEEDELDFGKDADRVSVALDATYQIETLVYLLLHVGDLAHEEATALHLPTVVKTMGVRIERLNAAIMSALGDQGPNGFAQVQRAVNGGGVGMVVSRQIDMVPA
ncbi:MAG: hypothetical protein B7X88_22665 [Polaromonas sp. 17-63-33]|nr:MAG: hypothetical protein B7Y09_09395 [Polaromonas sp. 24-63-21]OZA47306.1 MAG: hypothetical protein B7X88_22665 [Polaromonas sp. 17-63-33]